MPSNKKEAYSITNVPHAMSSASVPVKHFDLNIALDSEEKKGTDNLISFIILFDRQMNDEDILNVTATKRNYNSKHFKVLF